MERQIVRNRLSGRHAHAATRYRNWRAVIETVRRDAQIRKMAS